MFLSKFWIFFFTLRKHFLQKRMKIGLVKINMDADIFSSDNLEYPIEKGLSRKNQEKIKNGISLFSFFLSNNDGILILMGDTRPTSNISIYL